MMHDKYGFCRYKSQWVKRDDMLGINIKVFDANNNEERICIRLSEEGHEGLSKMLRLMRWDNILMTEKELVKLGVLRESESENENE